MISPTSGIVKPPIINPASRYEASSIATVFIAVVLISWRPDAVAPASPEDAPSFATQYRALQSPGRWWKMALLLRSIRLMKKQSIDDTAEAGLQREPDDWKTGDEPMTSAQRSYLETLCRETGEAFDDSLTKADASKRIDELRARSPRLSNQ